MGDVVVLQRPTCSPAGHTGSTSSLGPPHRGHWGPRLGPGPGLPVRVRRLARSLPRLGTWEPEPRMQGTGGAGMRSRGCRLHRLSPSAEFAPPGWLLSEPLWWAGRPFSAWKGWVMLPGGGVAGRAGTLSAPRGSCLPGRPPSAHTVCFSPTLSGRPWGRARVWSLPESLRLI